MNTEANKESHWLGIFKAGGVAAIAMLAIMVVQIVIFILFPPPNSVEGFFTLFQQNRLLGLFSLDLLYILNNTLLILIYLALYFSLRRSGESAALLALVLGLAGIIAYYASNTAFEMMAISRQYASASTEAQRISLMGAAQALFAIYRGTAFNVYYVLNAASLLIFSAVMLRSSQFSRATAIIGLISGVLMIIPSTAGTIGLIFSLASLVPWAVFCFLVMRKFLKMGQNQS